MNQQPNRSENGIDRDTFVVTWESSESTDECLEKLAAISREGGFEPMTKPVMLARASGYRSDGIKIKKYKPGRKPVNTDEAVASINEVLARLRASRPTQADAPREASKVDPALVDAVIREIARRLSRPD